MFNKYIKIFIMASLISLMTVASVFAFEYIVTDEAELISANNTAVSADIIKINGNITLTGDINLNAPIILTNSSYTITGDGFDITTFDGVFVIPDDATIDNLRIDGITNYANNTAFNGGAIDNFSSTFTINGGAVFTGNEATGNGGAINNNNNSEFEINDGAVFTGNTATFGGAIDNFSSTFTINGGAVFTNNTAAYGGAIYNNQSEFTIDGGADFINNTGDFGGAINNLSSSTFTINGGADFTNNTAAYGGAIWNDNSSTFTINGGAVFINNTGDCGGAIFNSNSTFTINDGAVFTNNTSTNYYGGAIYSNNSTTTLIADTNKVEFTGNTANGVDNAIYLEDTSILNLNASNDASVIFNDGITSNSNNNVININASNAENANIRVDAPINGEVLLNADMSGFGSGNTVNLHGGTLALGRNGIFFNAPDFNAYSGSTLNLINNKIDAVSFGAANINNMNLKIDVNLASLTADTLTANSVAGNDVNLTDIFILQDKTGNNSVMIDPGNQFDITLDNNAKKAVGQLYVYDVSDNGDGSLLFSQKGYNPVLKATAATQQNAYLSMVNVNNIAFDRVGEIITLMNNIKPPKKPPS